MGGWQNVAFHEIILMGITRSIRLQFSQTSFFSVDNSSVLTTEVVEDSLLLFPHGLAKDAEEC